MSSHSNDYSHLKELGKSNYEIVRGEPDIRHWVVKNDAGNILGEVDELIFDPKAGKVMFIVLDLDKNELNLKERKVLLPLEFAEIRESYKNVVYKGLSPNEISVLPAYEKGIFTRNSIDQTHSAFLTARSNAGTEQVQSEHNGDDSHKQTQHQRNSVSVDYSEHRRPQPDPLRTTGGYERIPHDRSLAVDVRPFIVIGVFEHSRQIKDATEALLDHGYDNGDITVSAPDPDDNYQQNVRDRSSIMQSLRSLFTDETDAKRYENAIEENYIVTVNVVSPELAEQAANILDEHDSLDMRTGHSIDDEVHGNTRVFKRH